MKAVYSICLQEPQYFGLVSPSLFTIYYTPLFIPRRDTGH